MDSDTARGGTSGDGGHGGGRRGGAGGRSAGRPAPRVSRRGLLLGGAAAAVGTGAVLAQDELRRLWWQIPGVTKPREEGTLDHKGAEWTPASRANWRLADRPDDYRIDRVIIHVVQGSYPTALRVFKNPGHGAATHYVVRKDGHVAQMIRELDVAFHAGNRPFNERSVGIEHEGFVDRPEDFTAAMYEGSARLTAGICVRYGLPADREHIIGHVEVPGTDHTDPGPHWDWDRYLRLVRAALPAARTAHRG
ncbi:N-acetylmuramoyl-L-alanine amidase [Streptomyces clavuligerus]|uniref:N-acetylmuramoyl-L-alanine amidase n=2 Tax=Streptomyces clavuligerus TaxID=1901 RepID=B5GVH1_STRCL|nr:N-acetylmuramoyl-L-alanine amidase [Streptomyces clavuligerus]ANW17949.1 N-acetylmuramoyl-L-alanine amidase [Streptomyces clavuligerus]AXU12507.1 N-acetylmuramoyl-L-alanine amidase [Streptomyces clavuligerus]EDY50317.1 N-acetylmuramoyl-L-alanine amidase [Streptomyces clavuligerus]EFG09486.1 N-acetylmuramoyl-L-alanine amidase [Streptomyces clavuligerus]MBY6302403.1 N-acetylmuramoyl-L-alanine amidase [Streptomyces clavuligerus]